MIIPAVWLPSIIVFASLDGWSHRDVLDILGKKKIYKAKLNSDLKFQFNSTHD